MPLRLLLQLPDGPRRVTLPDGEHLLGSAAECRVRVRHMTVSRRHARLQVQGDLLWVEDLGSSNGTSLDSKPVTDKVEIIPPARLSFGAVAAEVAAVAEADLIAAVPLPTTTLRPPEETSGAASHTLSSRALEDLTLRRLPRLIVDLSVGAPAAAAALRVGTDLFHALPCYSMEIWREEKGGRGILFSAQTEARPKTPGGALRSELGHLRFHADLLVPSMVVALEPVAQIALGLIQWSDLTARRTVDPDLQSPAKLPDGRSSKAPGAAPSSVDPRMHQLYERAERVAASDIGVLIRGESGTGKEVTARFIHRCSTRSDKPFVAINCAALPRDLLEMELFGIEKGVATGVEARPGKFEAAHDGTLFLDEIGDMALETQAKILRVLQEGEVYRLGGQEPRAARPRILSATHKDLEKMVESGELRRDLYFRLAGWTVELPALRDRLLDLPNLAVTFLAEEAARSGRQVAGISLSALEALNAYPWPGNIRELRHEIRRAALFLDDGELLDRSLLSPEIAAQKEDPQTLKGRLEQFERDEIRRTVLLCGGDVPRAAELLDIGRSTLYRRMKVLGLSEDELMPVTQTSG